MSLPKHIEPGFNFDEAIEMADLARRTYRVFDESVSGSPERLYEALYSDDEWQYIHGIVDYDTDGRCMILKRKGQYQFALVFRGSIVTGSGLELTNLAAGVEDRMVEYPPISREPFRPPQDARVHKGYWETLAGFADELQFFFEILVGSKLEQKLLLGLVESDYIETDSRIAALGAALRVKYGDEVQERVVHKLSQTVQQIKNGDLPLSSVSLDGLVAKEVKYRQVLKDLMDAESEAHTVEEAKLEVYVAGHSLGGALATLCVLTLKRYFESQPDFPPFALKKYTIGSPKTGNKVFADYYNKHMKGYSHRIQNLADVVPRGPTSPVPLSYYPALSIPGVDHIRNGDDFYAFYEHVGEAFNVFGSGHQTLDLDFGGPVKFSIPMPFPHGPDGYIAMLQDAREQQERMLRPLQGITQLLMSSQEKRMETIQQQLTNIQKQLGSVARNGSS